MSNYSTFPPDLEEECRNLVAMVCAGAAQVLKDFERPHEKLNDPDFRKLFFSAAHFGFGQAQERVIRLLADDPGNIAKLRLFRKIIDTAAWQMIRNQLYIARRLYKEKSQPSLLHSNLASTRTVANALTSADYYKFALLSDLTTFIQVGDLMTIDPDAGIGIIEVKEGEVNKKILDFVESIAQENSEQALADFRKNEGEKTYKQLERVKRQHARLVHVAEVIQKGKSRDPDTEQQIHIPQDPVMLEGWDEQLSKVLDDSRERGWAISHIDNCLFLGAYRNEMRMPGPAAFQFWFKELGGKARYPFANLMASMTIPLALPIFSHDIPVESKFDLVFGRAVVCVALHIDGFIELCNQRGLSARWSTRKEAAKFKQRPASLQPWFFENRVVLVGNSEMMGPISDGLFLRILFHDTRPSSAIKLLMAFD